MSQSNTTPLVLSDEQLALFAEADRILGAYGLLAATGAEILRRVVELDRMGAFTSWERQTLIHAGLI